MLVRYDTLSDVSLDTVRWYIHGCDRVVLDANLAADGDRRRREALRVSHTAVAALSRPTARAFAVEAGAAVGDRAAVGARLCAAKGRRQLVVHRAARAVPARLLRTASHDAALRFSTRVAVDHDARRLSVRRNRLAVELSSNCQY